MLLLLLSPPHSGLSRSPAFVLPYQLIDTREISFSAGMSRGRRRVVHERIFEGAQ
jgi:hypothetical protein